MEYSGGIIQWFRWRNSIKFIKEMCTLDHIEAEPCMEIKYE